MVEWVALSTIMRELNFPNKFIDSVIIYVCTVSYRFSINDNVSDLLRAKQGLWQGYPISPLLFVLVMEYLQRNLTKLQ